MRRLMCIVLLLAAAGVTPARAGYSEGGAFRTPGYGARAWGMAGAAIVTVDDESAVSWNPAMLGLVDGNYAGASYINLVPGETARQSQLAYVHVLQRGGDTGTVARHVVGAMVTNLSLELGGGESYSENFLRLAYAFTPEELVTFAAAGDVFISRSDVAGFDALGSSVDFAVRLSLTEHVSLGLVARNAFSRYSYENGEDDEKTRAFVLGVGYDDIPYATLEADVVFDHEDLGRVVAGFESDYLFDLLSVRGGIAYLDAGSGRAVPHFGFGLQAIRDRLRIHYNANLDDAKAFEDTHRFSLSVSL